VATVECARHELKRPNGVGDLQKGERSVVNAMILCYKLTQYCRQANMDYLFFMTTLGIMLLNLVASYDVACQWFKNLWRRRDLYRIFDGHLENTSVVFVVPKFHLPAHVERCHTAFSLNLTPGVGRTDAEGVERGWANGNRLANSTREMSPGHRRETLDDHFGDRNWKKVIKFGTLSHHVHEIPVSLYV
jgi:hypothetical protein